MAERVLEMAESYAEDAGSSAVQLDSPEVNENKENEMGEDPLEEETPKKIVLSRSESCGSILQGNGMNKIKNLSRRVSFPSDDKLISGYNEPKNPWEHAHETTTEDLIQAYTQACQTWNVRPITKLLVQLQEIKDFTVRANSLTLKGERIETRVVETLESIFKRVQFVTIDLEATNLDEDAGASLFDMIEYYESAVNVLVGFNKNLGNRGWQAAAHMMRKMSCLRLFDGHSVPLSIQASPFVGRALRLSNTLVTLHLENAMLSGRPILLIVAALRMNTTLRELFLADNRLTPLDALQLANLLKFNRVLQLLDLRNNPVQDMGLGHLCAGLMAQCGGVGLNGAIGGLQTLVLWNNQISQESMPKLAMALRYTVSLSTLNLGQNVLSDDGILKLKEGLLQNHSLLRLGLVGTKLTDEGAVAIAEYLAESPRIIRLDLRNNDIKVAGLMALSLAFKINHSLLRLDIDKPNKKDALKELAAKQESLQSDILSYSHRNKQIALEKAQALQARQEEERQAQLQEQNGLRYMDMTNSSAAISPSPAVTMETSVNNSNNSPVTHTKVTDESKDSKPAPAITSDADDSPEDSPEFLPRSSVSYHQVAPVMLSSSEMAKRAAAAGKLQPLHEHHEEGQHDTAHNLDSSASKLVSDAFDDAKEALAGSPQETQGTGGAMEPLPGSEGAHGDAERSPASKTETFSVESFAASLTANVLSGVTSKADPEVACVTNTATGHSLVSEVTVGTEGPDVSNATQGTEDTLGAEGADIPNGTLGTVGTVDTEGTHVLVAEDTHEQDEIDQHSALNGVASGASDEVTCIESTTQTNLGAEGSQVSIEMDADVITVETVEDFDVSMGSDEQTTSVDDEAMPEENGVQELPLDSESAIGLFGEEGNLNEPIRCQEGVPESTSVPSLDNSNKMSSTREQDTVLSFGNSNSNGPITSEESIPEPGGCARLDEISSSTSSKADQGSDANGNSVDEVCKCGTDAENENKDILDNASVHEHAADLVASMLKNINISESGGVTGDETGSVCNGNEPLDSSKGLQSAGDTSKLDNIKSDANVLDNSPLHIEVTHYSLSDFPSGAD